MREVEKHCNTCQYSYLESERSSFRIALRQKCGNPDYHSSNSLYGNIMEDWSRDFCCFWTPKTERTAL